MHADAPEEDSAEENDSCASATAQMARRRSQRVAVPASAHVAEVVPAFVELEVAVPRLRPAWW